MGGEHTPGPWAIEMPSDGSPNIWIGSATDSSIAKIECWDHDDGQGERIDDRDIANARLIAAAPDLLEACKLVVASGMRNAAYDACVAALARAGAA